MPLPLRHTAVPRCGGERHPHDAAKIDHEAAKPQHSCARWGGISRNVAGRARCVLKALLAEAALHAKHVRRRGKGYSVRATCAASSCCRLGPLCQGHAPQVLIAWRGEGRHTRLLSRVAYSSRGVQRHAEAPAANKDAHSLLDRSAKHRVKVLEALDTAITELRRY